MAPSRYGSTKYNNHFGAPLPSRYVVLERIKPEKTKKDLHDYIKWKNNNIPIRSIKLMSKPDSFYKQMLVEFSLEHFNIVRSEEFWPETVRVRIFKGNGRLWNDTAILQGQQSEVADVPTNIAADNGISDEGTGPSTTAVSDEET